MMAQTTRHRVYFMRLVTKDSGVVARSDEKISGISHRICKAECCVDGSIIAIPLSLLVADSLGISQAESSSVSKMI